jgi:FKBP-type peptidyl-prolyl cis-trans isomerase
MTAGARDRVLATVAVLVAAGCSHFGLDSRPVAVHRETSSTASGLKFEELLVGAGPAAKLGDQVTFEYTASLEDGTQVDSTSDRGLPMTVTLGSAPLKAWDEGLVGIQPHGRRRLHVPPELAYGKSGVPGRVPPDASLVIEVLALSVVPPAEKPKS